MINLWYEESYWNYTNGRKSGPEKVIINTIDALTQEKIPFSINQNKYPYNFLLQYQHEIAHRKHEKLEHNSCVIGPQVWPFDNDVYGNFLINNPQYYKKIIVPSQWVKDLYIKKLNISENKLDIWACGIPDLIKYNKKNKKYDCLIYFKNRSSEELHLVENFLSLKGLTYQIFSYGNYSQEDFLNAVGCSKFCFVLDNTESQGIAIQEIMSIGVPLLVWDVKYWDYLGEKFKVSASSIPYWSSECGEKFYNFYDLELTFERFFDNIDYYTPQELIKTQLSYKVSVETILKIFKK